MSNPPGTVNVADWRATVGYSAAPGAALPVARKVEYLTPSPYIDEIITEPFKPDAEGLLIVPDKPNMAV